MKAIILAVTFTIAIISGTFVICFQGKAQALRTETVLRSGQIMDQVQHRLEDSLARITEGLLDFGIERRNRSDKLEADIYDAQIMANRWAWAAAASLASAALLSFTLTMTDRRRCLAAVALACWILGLTLPILTLTVEAHITSPFDLGRLLLREETKSLLGLLSSLWEKQNWLLVGLVGVFGVAIPLIKTTCQFAGDNAHAPHIFAGWLARWALVDVVVVGIVVAFLGSQGDQETHADFRLGFWFFAASGLVSMMSCALKPRHFRCGDHRGD